jgi:hypothetical protein
MKNILYSLIIIAVVGGLIFWSKSLQNTKLGTLTSRDIALTCTTDMATEYHIHPELTIMLNGKEVVVPRNVGIQPRCMTSIHTHDEPHVLHVEAPVKRDFTLGDFFAVWQKDFSSTKLLDNTVAEGSEIVVTVNGEKVDTYENTILSDKDKIIITY